MERDQLANLALALGPCSSLALTPHGAASPREMISERWADRERYHLWRGARSPEMLLDRVERLLSQLAALDSHAVLASDPTYPAALRRDPTSPALLFVQGALPRREMVAIVGTRGARLRSVERAAGLAAALSDQGLGILSGGALGVDTAAHEGALSADGVTVAVLGSGLDRRYPEQNLRLFDRLAAGGGVVTAFPPGTPPLRPNFPRRNRIIAAWASVVVVVEAPARSGALNTARQALELGRPVLAMPEGAGARALLQRGQAAEVTGAEEVIATIKGDGPRPGRAVPDEPDQRQALTVLATAPRGFSVDLLAGRLGWTVSRAAAALVRLELAGLATCGPGGRYTRRG